MNHQKTLAPQLIAAPLLALSGPAQALYRCGNSYQDKPCSAAAAETPINPAVRLGYSPANAAARPTTSPSSSPFASACAQVGKEAQRIVWNREGGATREKQIDELPRGAAYEEMVKTIDSVYIKRGTAPEIRSQIEAECLVEKQRQADALATLKALNEQAGIKPGTTSVVAPAAAPAVSAPPVTVAAAAAGDPRAACTRLRAQDDALRASQPSRGDATVVKTIHEQRQAMDAKLSAAKC